MRAGWLLKLLLEEWSYLAELLSLEVGRVLVKPQSEKGQQVSEWAGTHVCFTDGIIHSNVEEC